MKPNIFKIATKELSQDAFFTWLLSYADKSCETIDKDLYACAVDFLTQLIKKQAPDFNDEIITVKAGRQWEGIDVWAEINDKYLVIIEDKTNTSQHSNQLERYKAIASKWCNENSYNNPICIYLKTGNESKAELHKITNQGFSVFKRNDIIEVLNKYDKITNDVYLDFKHYLVGLELSNNEFIEKEIGHWKSHDYIGFYQLLETRTNIINWHYVANPSGGFWNALLSWGYWEGYPTYIQLEEGKLCFKISTNQDDVDLVDKISRGERRNRTYHHIISRAKEASIHEIKKPSRFGNGVYMTVATIDKKHWLGNDDSLVDIENVISNLDKYILFLKENVKSN